MHTSFFSKHSYNLAFISRLPASSISSCGFVSTKPFTSFFTRWQGINVSAKTILADARQANAVVNPNIFLASLLKSRRGAEISWGSIGLSLSNGPNICRIILSFLCREELDPIGRLSCSRLSDCRFYWTYPLIIGCQRLVNTLVVRTILGDVLTQ